MAVSAWNAAHNGTLNQADALIKSGQVDQFLGTHPDSVIYPGNPILTPNGTGGYPWFLVLGKGDVDQPFTLSGTSIGRVTLPLLAVGNGADLLVSICQDSAGVPGAVLNQTRVPAAWISQLGAVSGVAQGSYSPALLEYTSNPLATGQFNAFWMGATSFHSWPYPTNGAGGPSTFPTSTSFGNYFIQAGGNSGATVYNNVYTIEFDDSGNLGQAVPQPSLPVATDGSGGAAVTTDSSGNNTLVFLGGQTAGSVIVDTVYTASFDASTGTIASWSLQQPMPAAANFFGTAAYGSYVYVVGGGNTAETTNIWYAQVVNGQITQWNTATPIPVAQGFSYCMAVNGFLFVFGGFISASLNTTYWAAINSNGSLGPWITGPTLPVATSLTNGNAAASLGSYGVYGNGAATLFNLGVGATGPDLSWQSNSLPFGGNFYAATEASVGVWQYYGLYTNEYWTTTLNLTPRISIPLPTTGLTNGTTYHVLMQQQGGDLNNYLRMHADFNTFSGNPIALTSNRLAYTWSNVFNNASVPLEIYDNTVSAPYQPPLHTWEDSGARVSTLITTTTPDRSVIGLCTATNLQQALNQNPGFETGLTPWTVTGGTAVRSSTQAFMSNYSCQVTPSGSATLVYLQSENLQCLPGQSITVTCRVWFTSAVTSNFSLSVNWYDKTGAYVSTSSTTQSVAAGTFASVTNTYTVPTTGTLPYQFTINPNLSGTPAAAQVWYVDDCYAYYTRVGAQTSSVVEITREGTWPTGPYQPTGLTTIA